MLRRCSQFAAVLVVWLLPCVTSADSFFVEIVGANQGPIPGDVGLPPVAGSIEAFELHHFVSRAETPGSTATHESIIFTKRRIDPSTVQLLAAWSSEEPLTVTFTFCLSDPTTCQGDLYKINLTGARIVVIEPWTRLTPVYSEFERIRMTYLTIEFVFPSDGDESVTLVP